MAYDLAAKVEETKFQATQQHQQLEDQTAAMADELAAAKAAAVEVSFCSSFAISLRSTGRRNLPSCSALRTLSFVAAQHRHCTLHPRSHTHHCPLPALCLQAEQLKASLESAAAEQERQKQLIQKLEQQLAAAERAEAESQPASSQTASRQSDHASADSAHEHPFAAEVRSRQHGRIVLHLPTCVYIISAS